jgi:large subunit ribosomal protein L15
MIKTKKRRKESRMHGRNMGTHGGGARKKRKGTGHKGGKGMSGSGKRADHKKTLVTKKFGGKYFGKSGETSRKTQRDIRQRINVGQIEMHLEKYGKKVGDKWEINLKKYKILGTGEVTKKLMINALEASKTAIEKVKTAGGEIVVKEIKDYKTPLVKFDKKAKLKGEVEKPVKEKGKEAEKEETQEE